jgi:hypothetical protein
MGQVYLAQDQNLMTRRVAVKTVRPDILPTKTWWKARSLVEQARRRLSNTQTCGRN